MGDVLIQIILSARYVSQLKLQAVRYCTCLFTTYQVCVLVQWSLVITILVVRIHGCRI